MNSSNPVASPRRIPTIRPLLQPQANDWAGLHFLRVAQKSAQGWDWHWAIAGKIPAVGENLTTTKGCWTVQRVFINSAPPEVVDAKAPDHGGADATLVVEALAADEDLAGLLAGHHTLPN